MEAVEFGAGGAGTILLIPGNMMTWHQFDELIPLLATNHHVIAVSADGYDGRTTFTTAEESAQHVEDWLLAHGINTVDLVFGESFGSATAAMLFLRRHIEVHSMILNGPQHMSLGPLNTLISWYIPRNQHRLLNNVAEAKATGHFPWLLKAYTRSSDASLARMFQPMAENISLETLQNAMSEALLLYDAIGSYPPDATARIVVWRGAKEPNMRGALRRLRKVFPALEDHPFPGLGHGEVLLNPGLTAAEIEAFMA